jgi:hypothetical protein
MQCMAEQLKKAFPVRKGPPLRLAQGTVTNRVQRLKFEKFRIAGACGRSGSQCWSLHRRSPELRSVDFENGGLDPQYDALPFKLILRLLSPVHARRV